MTALMQRQNAVALADRRRRVSAVRIVGSGIIGSEGFDVLIENGWYAFADMSALEVRSIADQLLDNPDAATERLCQRVRDRVDQVENELTQQFPSRRSVLADAFAAHRHGTFNLSVPVFIAQADGIWRERCGRNLFQGELEGTLRTALGDRVPGGIIDRLLQTLASDQWKLRWSQKSRAAGCSDLNRHEVLHGEVTGYGNEANSLKAISMLHFSNFVLRRRMS